MRASNETLYLTYGRAPERVSVLLDGKLYHERDFGKEPVKSTPIIKVNCVPSGNYTFTPQPDKIDSVPLEKKAWQKLTLPPPERNRFKKYTIVTNEYLSGTPARNYSHIGEIQVSPEFHNLSIQVQRFIVLHEIGHFFYETEWKCDLFALRNYLKLGFNPSNAFLALKNILSHSKENIERIETLYQSILK